MTGTTEGAGSMEYTELRKKGVYLGRAGEDGKKTVWLDVTAWNTAYDAGTGVLLFTSPSGSVWPMGAKTVTDDVTGKVTMEAPVTAAETALSGVGHIEAQWISGGETVKSQTFNTMVLESRYTGEKVPDSSPGWVADLITELNAAGTLLDTLGEVASEAHAASMNLEAYSTASTAAAEAAEASKIAAEAAEDAAETARDLAADYRTAAAASATAAAASAESAMSDTPTGYSTLVGSVAEAYSPSTGYNVGDYVLKDSQLYRCKTAIGEDGETWTSGHWTAVTAAGEIRDRQNMIASHIQVYLFQSGAFGYKRSGNTVTLDFGVRDLLVRKGNNTTAKSFAFSAIQTAAVSAGWTATETGIQAPNPSCGLYYNVRTEDLEFAKGTNVHTTDPDLVTLFECHYNSGYFGKLVEYETERRARAVPEIQADLTTAGTNITGLGTTITNLYKEQIAAQAYISDGEHFNYLRSGDTVALDWSGKMVMIRLEQNANAKQFPFETVASLAAESGWSVDGTALIAPNPSAGMYYDRGAESLVFTDGIRVHSVSPDCVILFENHYGSGYFGLLVDYETEKRAREVPALEEQVETLSGIVKEEYIPDYFKEHIETKIKAIRENMMAVGQAGETFVFITDIHWENNKKHSPALVRYIMENLNINVMLCGGDLINQGEREPMVEAIRECIAKFSPMGNIVMPCLFGNHDSNWNNWDHQREYPERYLDRPEQYALFQKQAENLVTYISSDKWNFYFDVPATKTRFIGLDTGENGAFTKYSDLATCMSGTPSGYHIVIFAHWLYHSGAKSAACGNLESMIDAYNAKTTVTVGTDTFDFTSAAGDVVLLLGGHIHNDLYWLTTGGVPVVLCDCDNGTRSNNEEYPYAAGTITEQAFDVFTLDYTTGDVKAVRIGRGADRTWEA